MLVELRGLPSDSTCVPEVEPGTLDIKDKNLNSIYQFTHWFTLRLQNGNYDLIIDFLCWFNVIDVIQKYNVKQWARHHLDQIKKIPVFRVTRPYLNLLVKTRVFSGFLGGEIILCTLKGEKLFKNYISFQKKYSVPTLPKFFRPVTWNRIFLIWPYQVKMQQCS